MGRVLQKGDIKPFENGNYYVDLTDEMIWEDAERYAQNLLGVDAKEAFAMLERGELKAGTLAGLEFTYLKELLEMPATT